MLKIASLSILIAIAAPAVAQGTAPPPPASTPEAKKNPLDKVVCKTEDTLGSRLGNHRVCATVREWKDREDQNRAAAEEYQQRNSAVVPSGE